MIATETSLRLAKAEIKIKWRNPVSVEENKTGLKLMHSFAK